MPYDDDSSDLGPNLGCLLGGVLLVVSVLVALAVAARLF